MVRRGPDDAGYLDDDEAGVHLSFRRLAIIDLTEHGHQPMISPSGDSLLVFNGELYGHEHLRAQLRQQGVVFRGGSDTEVVLAALEQWGESAIDRFDGMFAFAWWHRPSRSMVLAGGHAGIKPLFYATGPNGRGVCFGSQYDVVANGPWGVPPINPASLAVYLELHHVPAPHGLLERTGQLEPGELLRIEDGRIASRRHWWSLPQATQIESGAAAVDHVALVLTEAVDEQLVADRPVGTFLSGGVDSALVTSLAVDRVDEPLQSFTVSFPGASSDESAKATEFAAATGVDHHVLALNASGAEAAVDEAVAAGAEPVGDFSIVPTTLLAGFASERVTVALSGDGGDELFYGYVRPWSLLRSGRWFAQPRPVRRARYYTGRLIPGVPAVSEAVTATSPGDYYRSVNSRSRALLPQLGPDLPEPPPLWWYETPSRSDRQGLIELTRTAEYYGQLQRVLRKVDLASMHHSIEVGPRCGAAASEAGSYPSSEPVDRQAAPTEVAGQMAALPWYLDSWLDRSALRWRAHLDTPSRHWNLWTVLTLKWWLDPVNWLPRDFEGRNQS